MNSIGELLITKGDEIWSVTPQTSAFEALKIMSEKRIGALLVIEENKLLGIFSERDYARKVILKGKSSKNTPVSDLMTREVLYIEPQKTIDECLALMTAKRIRHLPVMDNERLIGILTIGDIVKQKISQQEFIINNLERYITGPF